MSSEVDEYDIGAEILELSHEFILIFGFTSNTDAILRMKNGSQTQTDQFVAIG
jgi:hypothetical protein